MQAADVTPRPVADLARNLWAAVHLLIFRRSALRWVAPTPRNFFILLVLSLTTSFLFDFLAAGWPGTLSPTGIAVYLIPSFIFLLFGQILSVRHGLWRLGLAPVSLWLAADILLGIGQCVLQYAASHNLLAPQVQSIIPSVYSLLFVWPVLALVFIFTRSLLWFWWERSLAFVVLLCAFFLWSFSLGSERIWYAADQEEDTVQSSRLQDEDAFYAQQTLLTKVISSLKADNPDAVDWYFLGVAGAAYQDVFRNEVETVHSLFDNRFSASGRSLVLINNDETVLQEPIATQTSIAASVNAIANKMNKEQDVLFLFITSHGSEDRQIELSYWPLDLNYITPEWLRQVLDDAGIRRRVIVLSACYAGGFIPALQTPDTLIITAASANQASFGCQSDSDLTYFGRAFFDESLRREYSLYNSYARAIKTISERESREGFEQSHPQWWIGAQMQQNLPLLEKTLFPPLPSSLKNQSIAH